jgi:hypothetical protein
LKLPSLFPMMSGGGQINEPVLGGDADVVVIAGNGLTRLDLNSREVSWYDPGWFSSSPVVANGTVYAINGGTVGAYDEKTGALKWTWAPPYDQAQQIIVTNSHLFATLSGSTCCIDLKTHQAVWSYPDTGYLSLGESTLYIENTDWQTLAAIGLGLPDIYVPESVGFYPSESAQTVTRSMSIKNVGDVPLEVHGITSSSVEFSVGGITLPVALAPGESVPITLTYSPMEGGTGKGNLIIASSDPDEPQVSVALTKDQSISVSASGGGRINPGGALKVAEGQALRFNMVPDANYQLTALFVDGVNVVSPSATSTFYTLSNITSDHSVHAVFTPYFDFYGMQAGNHFVSTDSASGQTDIDDISVDTSAFSFLSYVDTTIAGGSSVQTWYQETSNGLFTTMTGNWQNYDVVYFEPALPMFEVPFEAGSKWRFKSTLDGKLAGTATLAATVSPMTLVSVPAGYFMAWPIAYSLALHGRGGSQSKKSTEWFSPYIGTVKTVESKSRVALTSFKVGGGTVTTPPPVVSAISPASGTAGTRVVINGFQFGASGLVMIGNALCDRILSWSDTQIQCIVPQAATTGPVVVLTDTWASNSTTIFDTGICACGWANGKSFFKAPLSNLCSVGKASRVTGRGPWSWTCTGSNGDREVNCSANLEVNGVCGSTNGKMFLSIPTSNLCKSGTASTLTGAGPWEWTCEGENGGTNQSCSADRKVNGICGPANKGNFFIQPAADSLCSSGVASEITGSGPWEWSCSGLGGKNVSCSANLEVNGACGSSNGESFPKTPTKNLCSAGKASKVAKAVSWNWSCTGINGGSKVKCSADIQ